MNDIVELLKELSETVGVSGHEEAVRQYIYQAVESHVDEIKVDALGNMITLKRGSSTSENRLKVMLAAHMDEVGLMIVGYDDQGHLQFDTVGGIPDQALAGKRVQVGSDYVPGVVGIKPIHMADRAERQKIVKQDHMVIDVGTSGKDQAKEVAKVGDLAAFKTTFEDLGPALMGKAFDDRVGCAVLIDLLQGDRFPFDLYAVFTVQEEVGLRGAGVAAYAVEPDAAFVLDCTPAIDMPKRKDISSNTVLGDGPAIYVMSARIISDRRLVDLLMRAGDEEGIPYQIRQPGGGGTDAGSIRLARAGVPVVSVSVPCRYLHSPASIINRQDFINTPRLIRSALARLDRGTLER